MTLAALRKPQVEVPSDRRALAHLQVGPRQVLYPAIPRCTVLDVRAIASQLGGQHWWSEVLLSEHERWRRVLLRERESWRETQYLLASPANAAILTASASRESDIEMSLDGMWDHYGVPRE